MPRAEAGMIVGTATAVEAAAAVFINERRFMDGVIVILPLKIAAIERVHSRSCKCEANGREAALFSRLRLMGSVQVEPQSAVKIRSS